MQPPSVQDELQTFMTQIQQDPSFWKDVQHWVKEFSSIPKGANRASAIHQLVDTVIERFLKKNPTEAKQIACKKNCSHCCYLRVEITDDEADFYASITTDWSKEDKALLRKQMAGEPLGGREFLAAIPYQDRKCVFLKDNQCSIYEHRPLVCRGYFAADTNEGCKTESGKMNAKTMSSLELIKINAAAGMVNDPTMTNGTGFELLAKKLLRRIDGNAPYSRSH